MDMRWSLEKLYRSFNCREFQQDMENCKRSIEEFGNWVNCNTEDYVNAKEKLERYIESEAKFYDLTFRLMAYSQLTMSVDSKNEEALKAIETLEGMLAELAEPSTKLQKWIGNMENINSIVSPSEMLKEHMFYLEEMAEKSRYLLSDKEETVISKMRNTGSSAWSKLKDLVTSNLLVEIEMDGEVKKLPLTVIRNMAYDSDKDVRKRAYEAEIKSYSKIEDTVAAALNGIKGEVLTVCNMRGFDSPLDETLFNSRMDKETLDAMLAAMRESLPAFRKFYRRKAELLGENNGLPFYDLFAPMGKVNKKFTYDEAKDFIVENFATFSSSLSEFAKRAFENNWIDAEPREGKVGGAFCENLHCIGESRIMANFGENFNDVVTLAHELGHGYHGECLLKESALNCDYPMPIAETASTFCETIIKNAAMKNASKDEAFAILESELSDCAQVIVDIYSRFLFESEVFNRRKNGSMSASELKEIMLQAQKDSYGEGLNEEIMHPYMWVCKPHYYSGSLSFYNFPYAFGLLFAKGLYAEYLKKGEAFVAEYDKLLSVTGKNKIYDITKMAGIDIHSVDFWRSSLKLIEEDIEKFIELSK